MYKVLPDMYAFVTMKEAGGISNTYNETHIILFMHAAHG
jgi:hypothetical protein